MDQNDWLEQLLTSSEDQLLLQPEPQNSFLYNPQPFPIPPTQQEQFETFQLQAHLLNGLNVPHKYKKIVIRCPDYTDSNFRCIAKFYDEKIVPQLTYLHSNTQYWIQNSEEWFKQVLQEYWCINDSDLIEEVLRLKRNTYWYSLFHLNCKRIQQVYGTAKRVNEPKQLFLEIFRLLMLEYLISLCTVSMYRDHYYILQPFIVKQIILKVFKIESIDLQFVMNYVERDYKACSAFLPEE